MSEEERLSWIERRRIKKMIKLAKKRIAGLKQITGSLGKNLEKIDQEGTKELEKGRREMIIAMIGDKKNKIQGLLDVFEPIDENTGKNSERRRDNEYENNRTNRNV